MVRTTVGVADVSTLGKIDIQGADAARFLDFVYTNTFSTLPVGRVRYGLMLREDGMVMDDGTIGAAGREPLPDDHHHRRRGAGDAASRFRASGLLRRLGCADHLGHRKLGAVRRRRAAGADAAGRAPG